MTRPERETRRAGTLIVDPSGGGLSGDMFIACLFALGVDPRAVEREVARLPRLEPFRIVAGRVKRRGISVWRVRVKCHGATRSRDLGTILGMIKRSPLDGRVKELASRIFTVLGEAEGKIHGVPLEKVHFHEVGAVDSIVDIVGAVVALSMLGYPKLYHRPFRLGCGTVSTAHGTMPVPAPATIELLKGRTVRLGTEEGEVVTPTGAVLMKVLAGELSSTVSFAPKRIVYAAGTREPEQGPGILRVIEAELCTPGRDVTVLRTTIDDMNPEHYQHVQDLLFEAGALDVFLMQLIMKKGRPGILMTVLCEPELRDRIIGLIFRETTTLGVRFSIEGRDELERWNGEVETPLGTVAVKKTRLGDGSIRTAPEYESCRALARSKGVPIADVYREACSASGAPGSAETRGTAGNVTGKGTAGRRSRPKRDVRRKPARSKRTARSRKE